MKNDLAAKIWTRITALKNCEKCNNQEWYEKHYAELMKLQDKLPSGSGFDSGSEILIDESFKTHSIKIKTSFHHLNEAGFYEAWTDHIVTIEPDFINYDISVSGKNYNEIKEYITEVFYNIIESEE